MRAPVDSGTQQVAWHGMKKAMSGRAAPAVVVFLYAAFAAVWIFFSDRALERIVDPETITRLSTVKGFAFIVVTSSLLYLLLNGWRLSQGAPASGGGEDGAIPLTGRRVLLMFVFALVVPLFGLLVFKVQGPQVEHEAYDNLRAIARLKTEQIENWLVERRSDTQALADNEAFIEQAVTFSQDNDPALKALLRARLEVIQQTHRYASILLVDAQGWPLLALGEQPPFAASTGMLLPMALASGEVTRTELILDSSGRTHIDFIVPLLRAPKYGRQPVGAAVLRVYPERFLFPLIQSWPTASASAEILLVRREQESVVYLNDLRHRRSAEPMIRQPLATPDLPAAIAVRSGLAGTTAGRDYRAASVLTAYQPVKGTDWFLIAKVDRAEVLAPLWELVFWVCVVAFAALVAIGVTLQQLWRQQQRTQKLQFLVQKETALREGELRYRAVTESSSDAIVSADADGNIVGWNAAVERLFGYSAAELAGQPLTLLMPQRFHKGHDAGMHRVLADGAQPVGRTVEFAGRHKSGSEFPLELSLAAWAMDKHRFFTGTMRDITERKANEARLQRLTGVYAALSQCNQSIVRCANENELFGQICNDAVAFGGMKMAWVGTIDAESRMVYPTAWHGEGAEDYLRDIEVSIDAASPLGRGPVGTALREAHPVWIQDFFNDPLTAPWHERAAKYGWGGIAALPLYRGGVVVGSFNLYAGEMRPFDEAIRNLLQEMAIDVSLALDSFASEAKRVEAEARTRQLLAENETILRNALVGIVHLKDQRVVACNQRFEEIFGYASGELQGQAAAMFFETHEAFDGVDARSCRALGEGSSYDEEVIFRRKDGSLFEGALIGRAIDSERPLDGSIWTYADISERVRLENQLHNQQVHLEVLVQKRTADLEAALDAAKLADLAKDAFLANVSHELRTPLNAVIGMANLARRLSHDPAQQSYLDKVGNAGKTLAHLFVA